MKAQKYGRIINMASINGLIGFAGKAGYNSAKHGVIYLTKVAALECARDGITVNALCPGYVDTPLVRGQIADLAKTRNVSLDSALEDVILAMVPQKRLLSVEEIADYAIFLASSKAGGVIYKLLLWMVVTPPNNLIVLKAAYFKWAVFYSLKFTIVCCSK